MTKYLTCIKCDIEQPVTQFIAMKPIHLEVGYVIIVILDLERLLMRQED